LVKLKRKTKIVAKIQLSYFLLNQKNQSQSSFQTNQFDISFIYLFIIIILNQNVTGNTVLKTDQHQSNRSDDL